MAIYRQLNQEIKFIIDVFLLIHFHIIYLILLEFKFLNFVFLKIIYNNNKDNK
jgi:hypothetical protein